MFGKNLRRALTDVPDAEAEQNSPELQRPAGFDLSDEVFGRLLPHAFEFLKLIDGQAIDVGNIANEILFDELTTFTEEQFDQIAGSAALRYLPDSSEIAGAVVFFASDLAKPITGQALHVNAGHWFGG